MKKYIAILSVFLVFILPITAEASSNLIIKYNGKTISYQGAQLKVTYNGTDVNLDSTPGILQNNTALFSYQDLFIKSGIGATGNYNKSTKTITIELNGKKILMKLGSKTATVNGVKKNMTLAPVQVTYKKANKTKILVPSRFVAENLGLTYSWYSKTGTVAIENTTITPTVSQNDPSEDEWNTITIPKTDSNMNVLESKDDYWNRQYILTLQGDYTAVLNNSNITVEDGTRATVTVQLNALGNTEVIIKTNIIRGFEVQDNSSSIIVTVKPPKDIYPTIVVLDAGHGGNQPGTLGEYYGNELIEKEVTLDLVLKAKNYFDNDSKIKVYYTRLTDTGVSLTDRVKMANEVDADLFLSVHIDASPTNLDAAGTTIYYSSKKDQLASSGLTSSKFAGIVSSHLVEAVGSTDRGINKKSLQVLNQTVMPAVLIETAFISNENDVDILRSEDNRDAIGASIYDAILETIESYPRN
ncbi:N-acetylmuramoyl-L-alanine amidase [Anaeromicropila herbilytica]|uniref:MurNAc-LAA domain-containing protein n=1 Tax=Anaeromicropila herbilytica TaxID=2785025 RepID=A0A7R7EKL1_9FIRM|nr:N-acetylmuramoyl-L-alanine amidase [Anaeromicropila herbilytica]BCN30301.1 hypothetical protein bsdtb5_15960 [Anaeromicropila herbilytica]